MQSVRLNWDTINTTEDQLKICYAFMQMKVGTHKKLYVFQNDDDPVVLDSSATLNEIEKTFKESKHIIKCRGFMHADPKEKFVLQYRDGDLDLFTNDINTQSVVKLGLKKTFEEIK